MLSREQLYKLYITDREKFVDLYKHVRELQIKMARTDINAFIAYVMKEERVTKGSKEGAKLVQEPTHIELQAHVDKHQKTLIWGALGIGKCVSSWTRFTLEDGRTATTLKLKEMLEAGQEVRVWTLDKVTMQPRLVRVKSVSDNGIVNTIRVKTASGHSTLVSENHPFWVLQNGEWGWKAADQLESVNQVGERNGGGENNMRLMVHYGSPHYPRTLEMDNQEAFDLGFIVSLMRSAANRSVAPEHRHRDVVYACVGEGHPSWDRRFELVRTLIEIGDRRGLHVGASVYPKSVRLEIYGLSKWVSKYGLRVRHRQVKAKRRWNGEVYHKVVTSMMTHGIAIDDIHKYGQDVVRSYLAGCYSVSVRDTGEDAHPGILRPYGPSSKRYRSRRNFAAHWSSVGHAAGVGVRRHPNGAVYLEGKSMIKVAAEVSQRAPALAVHFNSITEKFEYDHRHVEAAEDRANRSRGVHIDHWRPRADHGPDVSAIVYVRRSRFKNQTWGVEIDDDDHTHLTDGILTHNTQQISVARSLFALGNNVNIRILIVQSTADLAKDILHQIKEMIEKSVELHEVFPNLKRGDLWQSREVRVQRTNLTILTPSIRAIGVETKIDGSRYDLIIVDDALSYENTRTQTERDNLYKWLISVPFSREEDWTWTIVIGNAWHHEDAMHRLEKLKEWHARRFPARDPKTGQTLLPKRWPMDRIAKWEGSRPPAEVRRSLDCFPAGTMILTRAGYVPIERVRVGDEVLTHKGRWKRVTQTMSTHRKLLTITGHGHPGLQVSGEHPFYTRERDKELIKGTRNYAPFLHSPVWKKATELGRGDYWSTPLAYPPSMAPEVQVYNGRSVKVDASLMWLAGRYLADGWVGVRNGVHHIVITCGHHKTDELRSKLQAWVRKGARCKSNEIEWHERNTSTAHQFITTFRGLAEWLVENFGKGAANKKVPGWALGMSHGRRKALLDGYVAGDGYLDTARGVVEASTVSKALAFGIKALACSLGSTVTVRSKPAGDAVIQGRKVPTRQIWKLAWRVEIDSAHRQTWRTTQHEWTPIRSVAPSVDGGEERVYNLSVETDESYVADGIVVHNCVPFSNETSRFDSVWFDRAFSRGIDILKDDDGKPVFWLQRYNLKAEQKKVELERQKIAEANLSIRLKSERKDPRSIRMPVSVMSGVDLGFGLTEESDFSVIFTAVFFDNGDVLPIMIDKGRYGPTEIIPRIINTHQLYGATIFVETSFTQKWVYDTISKQYPDIPVFPWKTEGRGQIGNKWDMIFGVESVAFDIGSDRWTLPCIGIESPYDDIKFEAHEIMLEFKDACLNYVPDSAVHTNDLLMAAWIMLQGARLRGSQEYLVALSDIGSMYVQHREDFETYQEPQSDEARWGREIATDLREFMEAAGLDYFYSPE